MNYQQKRAGQSTRDMARKRYRNRVWFVLVTTGIAFVILLMALNSKSLKISGIGFLALLVAARLVMDYSDARAKKMVKEERRAIRGAKGEERIGSILKNLGEDYLVIHDVESAFGNIDHIVISKQNGVFLIETKAHGGRVSANSGRLLVNGHDPEKDFIAQALNNTYWLRDKICAAINIEMWITPILVFTNAFVERTPPIKGVTIINKRFLLNALQRQPSRAQNPAIWENRETIRKALI